MLDNLEVEQERGITVKSQSVSLDFNIRNEIYRFNVIDTPGHCDFSYQVDNILSTIDAILLLVDATQGIQAQTIAGFKKARRFGKVIIPVINKIDLAEERVDDLVQDLESSLELRKDQCIPISAKLGTNLDKLIEQIALKVPHPRLQPISPLKKQRSFEKKLETLIRNNRGEPFRGYIFDS